MEIRERLTPLSKMGARPGRHIAVIKAALSLTGVIASPAVRLPLVALGDQEGGELARILKEMGAWEERGRQE